MEGTDDFYLDDEDDDETTAFLGTIESSSRTEADMARDWRERREGAGPQTRQTLGVLGVTVLAYFSVSGGPFGIEVGVAAGGPARTLFALVLFTVISALPSALMTAELSSALPGRSGYNGWVERGLSPRLGALNSWIALLNGAIDASAYPGVCWDYFLFELHRWGPLSPALTSNWTRCLVSMALTLVVFALNMAGIRLATRAAFALAVFSLAPFVLMGLACLIQPIQSARSTADVLSASMDRRAADLPLMMAVCLWSTSGFDSISFVSAEVGDTTRTVPRALGLAVCSMLVATALPILVSCAAVGQQANGFSSWSLGSFALPAEFFGGKFLGVWVCAAGIASSLGLLMAYLLTSALNVQAMAIKGLLPRALRQERGAEATPAASLLCSTACVLVGTGLSFAEQIELNMALYCASLTMEQLALLRLRWTEPDLRRPFRIPLSRSCLVLAFIPQLVLCVIIVAYSMRTLKGAASWALLVAGVFGAPRLRRRVLGKHAGGDHERDDGSGEGGSSPRPHSQQQQRREKHEQYARWR